MPIPSINGKLGRVVSLDPRDYSHLARRSLDAEAPPPNVSRFYFQPAILPLDQGQTSSCVAHAWAAALMLGPISQGKDIDIMASYRRMIEIDELPGTEADGTTTRAGAKVAQENGFITSYVWGAKAIDAQHWIQANRGPVVIGVNWYDSMFDVNDVGYLEIPDNSQVTGGHAVVLCGYSVARDAFSGLNSWGAWGNRKKGLFWMSSKMLDRLMSELGDMCMPVEVRKPV